MFKDLRDIMQDQFFHQHIPVLMPRDLYHSRKYFHIARYDSKLFMSFLFQHNYCMDIFILQKRKRLFLTNNLRRQERMHFLCKICIQKPDIFLRHICIITNLYLLLLHLMQKRLISLILARCQMTNLIIDCKQLFLTGHSCFVILDLLRQMHLIIQRSTPYHKKFIQITLKNREE